MAGFPVQDLRRNVVGGAADCLLFLSIEIQFRCQAEVPEFELHFVVYEEVPQFEVAVNDLVVVQVLEGAYQLVDVGLHLDQGDPSSALDQLIEGLIES